jgi:hypothetical protein
MSQCLVSLRLDGDRHRYAPGDQLTGEYRLDASDPDTVTAVELSVLWYTEGTGDEDLAVHYFERMAADQHGDFDARLPRQFSTRLPKSPLSYDGLIVKLHWCVRVRAFLRQGKDAVAETPFQLGDVPPAREVEPPATAPGAVLGVSSDVVR